MIMYECGNCGMLFTGQTHARRHAGLIKCRGAAVARRLCGITKLSENASVRKRQTPSTGPQDPDVQAHTSGAPVVVNYGDHSTAIGTVIVVTSGPGGDVVKAGSALESELIQKTILENAELRRMIRTIENAPSAIFNLTKGASGPQALRNVRKDGRRACELRETGTETSTLVAYCKRTAVKMVEELRRAMDSVTPEAPAAVREWANDVSAAMRQKLCGNLDYPTALQLYCEASSRFYKLPEDSREAIACGVRDIGRFISETAAF